MDLSVAAPLSQTTSVRVRPVAQDDRAAWAEFVSNCADATLFHRIEWKDVMERVFRHRTHYLLAESEAGVAGVLPLAEVRSVLFGHALVSLPFCVYGGAVSADPGVVHALHEAARDLAATLGVTHLELRNRRPTEADWPRQDLYATFRKPLLPDLEANFKAIPSKRRNMVRKAEKSGLRVEMDG